MQLISINDKVYDVIQQYPETLDILVSLGFTHLSNPAMLATAGKVMTISKAAKRHNLTYEQIELAFSDKGFQLKEKEL